MGAYGIDLGSFTPFLYAFREREEEDFTGSTNSARLTYFYVTIGGDDDPPDGWIASNASGCLDESP